MADNFDFDPTHYDMSWRTNYELHQVGWWLAGGLFYLSLALFMSSVPSTVLFWLAGGMFLFALTKAYPAYTLLKKHMALAGSEFTVITIDDVRKLITDKRHKDEQWLGRGFIWEASHTQRVADLLKRDWKSIIQGALGWLFFYRFIKRSRKDKDYWIRGVIPRPYNLYRGYQESKKSFMTKGQPWIHGVGCGDENIYQPLSHTRGHTLILGTTGAGKTRLFDLLVSQCIMRGEMVVIIDPKGDQDLENKARQTCKAMGREHAFHVFHPARPEESMRINLLANWARSTEVPSRIVKLLVGSNSGGDAFSNFAWEAMNAVCQGLIWSNEKPTLVNLLHYIEGSSLWSLTRKTLEAYFIKLHQQSGFETIEDYCHKQYGNKAWSTDEDKAKGYIRYYREMMPKDPSIEGLIRMAEHDTTHFSKMIANVIPILSMLTTGNLGTLLSPPDMSEDSLSGEDMEDVYQDTAKLIQKNAVVYMGLDSLSDGTVGSAIGSLMLCDLASAAGAIYNHVPERERKIVNIFVDEAAEVTNETMIQILNKGRGANFKLTVATQTIADFSSRTGSKDKAMMILGNTNDVISLRIIDPETQDFVLDKLTKTKIKSVMISQSLSTDASNPFPKGGNLGERLSEEEAPIFPSELLPMLPDLEYLAIISGGNVVKGRIPIITVNN